MTNNIFTPGESSVWYSFSSGEIRRITASGTSGTHKPASPIKSMIYCGKSLFAGDSSNHIIQCDADLKTCKTHKVPFNVLYMACNSSSLYMAGHSIKVLKSDATKFKWSVLWEHSSWVTGLGTISGKVISCSWDKTCRKGNEPIDKRRFSGAVSFLSICNKDMIVVTDDLRLSVVDDNFKIKSFTKSTGVVVYLSPIDSSNRFATVSTTDTLYKYEIVNDRIRLKGKILNIKKEDVWMEKGVLKYSRGNTTENVF